MHRLICREPVSQSLDSDRPWNIRWTDELARTGCVVEQVDNVDDSLDSWSVLYAGATVTVRQPSILWLSAVVADYILVSCWPQDNHLLSRARRATCSLPSRSLWIRSHVFIHQQHAVSRSSFTVFTDRFIVSHCCSVSATIDHCLAGHSNSWDDVKGRWHFQWSATIFDQFSWQHWHDVDTVSCSVVVRQRSPLYCRHRSCCTCTWRCWTCICVALLRACRPTWPCTCTWCRSDVRYRCCGLHATSKFRRLEWRPEAMFGEDVECECSRHVWL